MTHLIIIIQIYIVHILKQERTGKHPVGKDEFEKRSGPLTGLRLHIELGRKHSFHNNTMIISLGILSNLAALF